MVTFSFVSYFHMYSSSKKIIARISKTCVASIFPTTQPPSYSFRTAPLLEGGRWIKRGAAELYYMHTLIKLHGNNLAFISVVEHR